MRIKHLSSSLVIILIMTVTSPCAFANLLVNGDFETGTAGGWSPVGPTLSGCGGDHDALQYSLASEKFCRSLPLIPPYDGQAFAGYARTGGGVVIGFEQTVSVTPGVSTFFSLDFAVREVQIPGQARARLTVRMAPGPYL